MYVCCMHMCVVYIYVCSVHIHVWYMHCVCIVYKCLCVRCVYLCTQRGQRKMSDVPLYHFLSYFHEAGYLIAPGARLLVNNPLPPTCPCPPLYQLRDVRMAMGNILCGWWGSELRSSCIFTKHSYLLIHLPSPISASEASQSAVCC